MIRTLLLILIFFTAGPTLAQSPAEPPPGQFVMITDNLETKNIELVEINPHTLIHRDNHDGWTTVKLNRVLALHRPSKTTNNPSPPSGNSGGGLLTLTDGQQLPGQAVSNAAPNQNIFAWNHPWLGRLEIPLDRVSSVSLLPITNTLTKNGSRADLILLANGDQLEGIVLTLGNPLVIETESGNETAIPLGRIAAIYLVSPPKPRVGTRIWFQDGTIIDVQSLRVSDDQFLKLNIPLCPAETKTDSLRLDQVQAILFPGDRLLPLTSLEPLRITGPATRYTIPPPKLKNPDAPLHLSNLELHGPLTVRYALPPNAKRLAATVILPPRSRTWGDYEIIIRCDGIETWRATLNANQPEINFNLTLNGSELTLELTEGKHGPIQDACLLKKPMLLK